MVLIGPIWVWRFCLLVLSLALSVIDLLAAMFSGYGLMYLTLSFFQVMVWISTYDWSLRRVCSHSLARPMAYCRWLGTERIIFAATSHKNGSTISAGSSFPRVRETAIFSTFQIQWELFTYCSYLWLWCSFKSYDLFRAFIILWIPLIRSTYQFLKLNARLF